MSGAPSLSPHLLPEAWLPATDLLGKSRSFQYSLQICNSVFQELKHRCRSNGTGLTRSQTEANQPWVLGAGTFILHCV